MIGLDLEIRNDDDKSCRPERSGRSAFVAHKLWPDIGIIPC